MNSYSPFLLSLRQALRLDALASGAMGALLVIAAVPAESLLGLPVNFLRGVGLALLPFAAFLVWLASRSQPSRALLLAVVVGNIAWVVASLALLGSDRVALTILGIAFVIAQAAAVAIFAALEYQALREPAGDSSARQAPSGA